jgi:hypothetical protein
MTDIDNNAVEKWECYLCCKEDDFEVLPSAYIANYHPLCRRCADYSLYDREHSQHYRLTYHELTGDLSYSDLANLG